MFLIEKRLIIVDFMNELKNVAKCARSKDIKCKLVHGGYKGNYLRITFKKYRSINDIFKFSENLERKFKRIRIPTVEILSEKAMLNVFEKNRIKEIK